MTLWDKDAFSNLKSSRIIINHVILSTITHKKNSQVETWDQVFLRTCYWLNNYMQPGSTNQKYSGLLTSNGWWFPDFLWHGYNNNSVSSAKTLEIRVLVTRMGSSQGMYRVPHSYALVRSSYWGYGKYRGSLIVILTREFDTEDRLCGK